MHVSKAMIQSYVQNYCFQQFGVPVSKVVKIEELPYNVRHACIASDITFLPQMQIAVPTEYGCTVVYFYFCANCGKLFLSEF